MSLNEFTFTIPEGFGPIEALSFNESDDGLDQSLKFFVNDKEQVIMTSLFIMRASIPIWTIMLLMTMTGKK